jgi:hypothetical protein
LGKSAPHTMEIGRVHVGGEHGLKGRFQKAIGQSVEAFLETVQSAYTLLEGSRIGSEGERSHHFSTANIPSDRFGMGLGDFKATGISYSKDQDRVMLSLGGSIFDTLRSFMERRFQKKKNNLKAGSRIA